MKGWTTVAVKNEVSRKLGDRRQYSKESKNDVIERLLECSTTTE